MGRPLIGPRAMTGAERLRRHRAKHGRAPDPTNAESNSASVTGGRAR